MTAATIHQTVPATWRRSRGHHSFGFWVAAVAFLVNMGFSAVPTPLYVLYQRRDHFSTLTITVIYAVYAVGVIGSLFLAGHVSDWVGRKRVFVPALLANIVSAGVFLVAPSLAGLLVARVISGISIGMTTATATAYLAELHIGSRTADSSARRAQVVATAANLGGIGVGPLVAGFLAQYAPDPLHLPYIVFGVVLAASAVLVALSPETVARPDEWPAWRPQRVAVPAHARAAFFAATAAGFGAFATFGVFTSLAPTFLAGTLHRESHALAGSVAFAAFASGAVAQIVTSRLPVFATLRVGPWILVPGLGLLMGGMWTPSLWMFVAGALLVGAGSGLVFRGALSAAASTAPAESRAEVLSGFFLGAYVGLSVPIVGVAIAERFAPATHVMLVFVIVVALMIVASVRQVLRHARQTV